MNGVRSDVFGPASLAVHGSIGAYIAINYPSTYPSQSGPMRIGENHDILVFADYRRPQMAISCTLNLDIYQRGAAMFGLHSKVFQRRGDLTSRLTNSVGAGHRLMVEYFLSLDASPNQDNQSLLRAVRSGESDLICLLLHHAVDPKRSSPVEAALMVAVEPRSL
ncbi:unnamed protein product [Clonostachys solani]|uniref:Uncharacterized protein n=1 Tax=Clonostachys solani TaxID=160281 RepID=A0A9N9WBH7_9HYPO|nr:unnamed protein product [Clonostachys solani]